MEGENCRGKGCEFERLGVDDIYAYRSYHRLFCALLFLLPIFFPASSSSYPLIFPRILHALASRILLASRANASPNLVPSCSARIRTLPLHKDQSDGEPVTE